MLHEFVHVPSLDAEAAFIGGTGLAGSVPIICPSNTWKTRLHPTAQYGQVVRTDWYSMHASYRYSLPSIAVR